MSDAPTLPQLPWQLTGNHWLAIPCIHPADGAIHAVSMLHRGSRSAIDFTGGAGYLNGGGPPLLRPTIAIDDVEVPLSAVPMAWERAMGWLPTFTATVEGLVIRGTVFAPYGRDADVAGLVYALSVEVRDGRRRRVRVGVDGTLGHRQLRVRSPRPFADRHQAVRGRGDVVVLQGSDPTGLAALAVAADGAATVQSESSTEDGDARWGLHRELTLEAGARVQVAFYLAAGPERDGAEATVAVLRRRGWRDLLAATRDALRALEQSTGDDAIDRLVNRNLLFAYFYGVGRALDDAQYYLVRSRAPWHAHGVTTRDWEALCWTLPAVQLADTNLARELILRMCELHGYAPGRGVHYLDGTLFEPGFSLEGAASYALAVDRYIRETGDERVVDEPVLADTLYLSSEDIADRRHAQIALYSTEIAASGAVAPQPFTLHANAVVAQALDVFRRTLDEETARAVDDPEAVRAAVRRHFAADQPGGKSVLASAIDLAGARVLADDPLGSVLWLPLYETLDRTDSAYRRTVKALDADPTHLAQQCARVMGPDAAAVVEWLRRAPLDGGIAAESVDAEGRALANGGDAALAGLVAWAAWYAVHALGVRP